MGLYRGMLVGNSIQVVASTDGSLVGRSGIIVEETKNTLALLATNERRIRIAKSVITLKMHVESLQNYKLIEGSNIIGTPADRIKN